MLPVQSPMSSGAYRLGGTALFLAAGGILTALGFQYIGGYAPCPLCLLQRYAYYAGIPAVHCHGARFGAAKDIGLHLPRGRARFLFNAALGGYHSGVEWKFWPAPIPAARCRRCRPRQGTCSKKWGSRRSCVATRRLGDSFGSLSQAGTLYFRF